MQLPIPFNIKEEFNINNFLPTSNQNIIYQLDKLINDTNANLFIYGKNYGKTHLMQAYTLLAFNKKLNVIYFNFKQSNNFFDNIEDLALDLLFLDNIESADYTAQQRIVNIYNTNASIIASAREDNSNLSLLADLSTRINQSIKLAINDLSDLDKIKVIKNKIMNNLIITDKNLNYLLNHYSRDLKKLINIVKLLNRQSLIRKQKITKKLIDSVITN